MEAHRLGNNDIGLIITMEELSQLKQLTKKRVVFTSKLQSPYNPLNGKEIQLIYDPDVNADGLDGRDMVPHFYNPPIPVYIGNRGIKRLQQGDYPCGGAVLSTKIEIKVQKP